MKTQFHASRKAFSDAVIEKMVPILENRFLKEIILMPSDMDKKWRLDLLITTTPPMLVTAKVRTLEWRRYGDVLMPIVLLNSKAPAEVLLYNDVWVLYVFADEKTQTPTEAYFFPIHLFRRADVRIVHLPPKNMLMAALNIEELQKWRIL